jgi:hypothetical protein
MRRSAAARGEVRRRDMGSGVRDRCGTRWRGDGALFRRLRAGIGWHCQGTRQQCSYQATGKFWHDAMSSTIFAPSRGALLNFARSLSFAGMLVNCVLVSTPVTDHEHSAIIRAASNFLRCAIHWIAQRSPMPLHENQRSTAA